jgi:CheY-like chemotaxis protein
VFGVLLLLSGWDASASPPQKPQKRILLLYGQNREHPAHQLTDKGIRSVLTSDQTFDIELYTEYLDLSRFEGPGYKETLARFLNDKYSAAKPDLFMTVYPNALKGVLMRCGLVILADRHPSMLEGIRRMLETEVESVLMVADEVSLMQAVEKTIPDLVVADLSLPIFGAGNVVRLLKKHYPDIRVIIMSVHDERAVVNEVMEAGAEGFVLKRRTAIDLLPAITEVSQGRRYVSPDVEM